MFPSVRKPQKQQTGRAAEEITFSLIKRKIPNKSSALLLCGDPVALPLQEIFLYIVMGTESQGKHSHFPAEKLDFSSLRLEEKEKIQ